MDANQLQQTQTVTYMDPAFYNAAAEGKVQVFEDTHDPLNLLLTPNKNTILHIYITSLSNIELESKTKFVEEVLDICSLLLQQCNAKGETPLHIAARYGHASIVEVLIERAKAPFTDLESQVEVAKEMLGMTNQEGDTALHEAVRYNHLEVVRLLLAQDPNFPYSVNKAGETLLYMAIERCFVDMTLEILDTCTSPAYTGPLSRTALHAAVFWNDKGIIKRIRQKIGILTTLGDQKGWTLLHLAAYFNCPHVVRPLLDDYRQMAYMKDEEGRIALHIAAYESNDSVVREIISSCPDCCELVDRKGCNALHLSMEGKRSSQTTRIFLKNPSLTNLLNEKDVDGNTTLHHHFKSRSPTLESFVYDPRVDKLAFNNQNFNILDLASTVEGLPTCKVEDIAKLQRYNLGLKQSLRVLTGKDYNVKPENNEGTGSIPSGLDKIDEVHPVVATLVAAVSFAAGINVPGGFVGQGGPNLGSAVLATSLAFQFFVIFDSLALLLSTWAVMAHAIRALPQLFRPSFKKEREFLASWACLCTLYALMAMVAAFVAGTYAVLEYHYSFIAVFTWTATPFIMSILFVFAILDINFRSVARVSWP